MIYGELRICISKNNILQDYLNFDIRNLLNLQFIKW